MPGNAERAEKDCKSGVGVMAGRSGADRRSVCGQKLVGWP